ncbi:protein HESO1-like isoform X2 [Malania oleifera]|uniref:protein HESO1-like isoform X2 n=1 Tax=Malania oleifera TaxID=397392 RepID=UPI0025ADA98F|nr:protein HESO1-like isoform X2 [Malania oleifera]
MALGEAVLPRKAMKLESKGMKRKKITPVQAQELEELLRHIYVIRCPKPSDYYLRSDLIRVFNAMAKEIYGNHDFPIIEEFGSFLMDMFSAKSDLDLSINFSKNIAEFPREKKIQVLRKFAKKLYNLQARGHVSRVQPIMSAKVPIVKVTDRGTGIECDISVENRDGIVKSQVIRFISTIDERFQKLSFLMKDWAKAHKINSSKDRTLNSLSIISLVAFHLQTRDPPILPPFSAIFKDGTEPASVMKMVQKFLNYGQKNTETLAELLVSLLNKLASAETLWPKGLCVSTYEGSWIYKTWNSRVGCISIEDFTDRSQNVARAVGTAGVRQIYKCIHGSLSHLMAYRDGQIQGPKLRKCLFGLDTVPSLESKDIKRSANQSSDQPTPDSVPTKKMRLTEGWGGEKQASAKTPNNLTPSGWGGEQQAYATPSNLTPASWGGEQQAYAKTPSNLTPAGWGGEQQVYYRRPNHSTIEGWGGEQHLYNKTPSNVTLFPSILIGDGVSYAPPKIPPVPTWNQTGFEGSFGSLLQPPSVPPQNPLGFQRSNSLNPEIPMPYLGPMDVQHAWHSFNQDPGRAQLRFN